MSVLTPLFDENFLLSVWYDEYQAFKASPEAAALESRLRLWADREALSETQSEAAFIARYFVETWGYAGQGVSPDGGYTFAQQYRLTGAGQSGNTGSADLALGNFGPGADGVPQVLCEFKDIRSGLDDPQPRKGSTRSPVEQGLDYLTAAFLTRNRAAAVVPAWAVVTDMNEFRLYSRLRGPSQCQRFVIRAAASADAPFALLPSADAETADAESFAFRRFIFIKLFGSSFLLARSGESAAEALLASHGLHEREIEEAFYSDYRDYREALYRAIDAANPAFPGTRGHLVRLTQRLLDRCLFVLFCEDMGRELSYPPQLLRDLLVDSARSRFYSPESDELWTRLKELFAAMRDGGAFGGHTISRFNGGLFACDPELDALRIPARLFCAPKQGATQDDASLLSDRLTLLYFSARYNFGKRKDSRQRTIGLTTLGRIFEQSITELEIMEAEADGRVSLNKLGKRKTDGVYYTPEWVTHAIVEEVVGGRLGDLRAELGFADLPPLTDEAVAAYRAFRSSRGRRTAPVAGEWLAFLKTYRLRVDGLRVVDPACGSGAFLIQALDRLIAEYRWIVAQEECITGVRELWNQDALIRSILSLNLYGVDINPESVEITQLALWLHTAAPNTPLCTLDRNIRCGNSLVGPDFYADQQPELLPAEERERVNVFDWREAFPQVFERGGFDCVIGNPPYIKLQNFRRAHPDVVGYLTSRDRADGSPLYASTRSGNFDLYLPFIEKGLALLRPGGRMGYIAPNVWLVNEYGESLRRVLRASCALDRWVDFKSFQVFEEATTYTALQFFRAEPRDAVACLFAADGPLPRLDWTRADAVPYDELPTDGAWNFMPTDERRLIARLNASCRRLDDPMWTQQIFQGLITSADEIYQLERLAAGRYRTCKGRDVVLEDCIMRPLISGPEAKRYLRPATNIWILFPYTDDGRLLAESELSGHFPSAWHYLQSHEAALRGRERGAFDDPSWYRFGRNQNINKQHLPKLCVAQTVPNLRVAMDLLGEFCINNVRVNGILAKDETTLLYLFGILNAPVCDFVFRKTAKPKDGGYFEANKQFIAPLPIPDATPAQRGEVGRLALRLQDLHTRDRELADAIDARLASTQTQPFEPGPEWLWADVRTPAQWKADAPANLTRAARTAWAKDRRDAVLAGHLAALDAALAAETPPVCEVAEDAGRLTLRVNGRIAVGLFDKPAAPFIAAQWRHALRSFHGNAKRLLALLLKLRATPDAALASAVIRLVSERQSLAGELLAAEGKMNGVVFGLYGLAAEDREQVLKGRHL